MAAAVHLLRAQLELQAKEIVAVQAEPPQITGVVEVAVVLLRDKVVQVSDLMVVQGAAELHHLFQVLQ